MLAPAPFRARISAVQVSLLGPVEATLATELGLGLEQQDFTAAASKSRRTGTGGLGCVRRETKRRMVDSSTRIHLRTQPLVEFRHLAPTLSEGQDLSGMGGEAVELQGHRGISASCKNKPTFVRNVAAADLPIALCRQRV